jgi:hypothetical protein
LRPRIGVSSICGRRAGATIQSRHVPLPPFTADVDFGLRADEQLHLDGRRFAARSVTSFRSSLPNPSFETATA